MSLPSISVQGLSKRYRLGVINRQTLRDEVRYWWHRARGRNPALHMGPLGKPTPSPQNAKNFYALNDVSFEIHPGEVVGIIGRNGAGKSTLLKILGRITEPSEGMAILRGKLGSFLEVGTGFHPELTGRENLYMNGAILGMKEREMDAKLADIVAFAEVDAFLDTPVKRYSTGMYVRLAFAVAAHLEPDILLVDEVLAVGDAAFQQKCLGKLESVASEGRTILFVSHNLAAVRSLCRTTMWLHEGRIRKMGPSDEVVEAYLEGTRALATQALAERTDRQGTGALRFTGARLETASGTRKNALKSWEGGDLVLGYRAEPSITRADFSICFRNLQGQLMAHCHTRMAGQPYTALRREGEIRCHIPQLPFAPGTYLLDIRAEVNGLVADALRDALQIEVFTGDQAAQGTLPMAPLGAYLVPHEWR